MFIEKIIGSKPKVKILRVLSEIRTSYTAHALKKETGLSSGIISMGLRDLTQEGILLKIRGKRKERLYKFNNEHPFAIPLFDLFRIEKSVQRKDTIILKVWSLLEIVNSKIKGKIDLLMLFGSHVRGDVTVVSDIDILIVPKLGIKKEDLIETIKSISKQFNPLFLDIKTLEGYMKKQTPLFRELVKDGIILFAEPNFKKKHKEFFKRFPIERYLFEKEVV